MRQKSHIVWLLALLIGSFVSWAAIVFREIISLVQLPWLGTATERVVSAAATLPWYVIVAGPTIGGLLVGLLLQYM